MLALSTLCKTLLREVFARIYELLSLHSASVVEFATACRIHEDGGDGNEIILHDEFLWVDKAQGRVFLHGFWRVSLAWVDQQLVRAVYPSIILDVIEHWALEYALLVWSE